MMQSAAFSSLIKIILMMVSQAKLNLNYYFNKEVKFESIVFLRVCRALKTDARPLYLNIVCYINILISLVLQNI